MTGMVFLQEGICVDKDCVRKMVGKRDTITLTVQLSSVDVETMAIKFKDKDEAEKAFSRIFDDLR